MRVYRLMIVVAAVAFARPVAAQGPFSLDLGGGPSVPFGQAKTNASSSGFNGLVGVIAHAPFVPFNLRIDGAYNEYDHTSAERGARQIWAVSGNLMYMFPIFPVTPYVLVGAGWYHSAENLRPDVRPEPTVPTLTATYFGIDGGAGVRRHRQRRVRRGALSALLRHPRRRHAPIRDRHQLSVGHRGPLGGLRMESGTFFH
jgi:hypothetical protein